RHRPLAAGLPARPAAAAAADPAAGAVLAVGLAGPRRHPHPGPGPGAGTAERVPLRAGARTLPPGARRPLARFLARGGAPLPRLARRTRLLPRGRAAAQGRPARAGGLKAAPARRAGARPDAADGAPSRRVAAPPRAPRQPGGTVARSRMPTRVVR